LRIFASDRDEDELNEKKRDKEGETYEHIFLGNGTHGFESREIRKQN